MQYDLATSEVRYVWLGVTPSGADFATGFRPAGPSVDLGNLPLATALAHGFATAPHSSMPLQLTSGAPVLGTTMQTTTDALPWGAGFGVRLLGLQALAGQPLDGYGAVGCRQYVVPVSDLKEHLNVERELSSVIASDIMRPAPPCVTPDQRLADMFPVLLSCELRNIPVVNNATERRLIGSISRAEALGLLSEAIVARNAAG